MNKSPFARGLIFVLIAILLVGGMVFVNRILFADTFTKEEAQHALYGLWLWRDLRILDFGAFLYDTGRQMVWPFLHSWVLCLFFLVFGPGYTSARFLSLVLFLASVFLIYLLSSHFSEEEGPKMGMVSVLLALTSPLMIRFASENMLEGLGAFLFLAALYTYVVCEERKITIEYVVLALLIGLSIYTNYLYAYLMIPAFLVMTLVKLGPLVGEAFWLEKKGEHAAIPFIWWAYRKLIALFVLLLLGGLWFSFSLSRKLLVLLNSIFKYSGGERVVGWWQTLSYYPRVIIQEISFSPWLGIFLLLSLFLPFIASRYRMVNKLFVFVWTVLLLLTLTIPAKAAQMLYIIIPFILMIFSAALYYVLGKLKEKNSRLAVIGIAILLLPALLSLPRAGGIFFAPRPPENMRQVLDYFKESLPRNAGIVIPLNLQHLNPEVVEFHFKDWEAPILADVQLNEVVLSGENQYLLTIELEEGSPYQKDIIDDSLDCWNAWLHDKEMNGEVRLYSSRRFGKIRINAKIYTKTSSFISSSVIVI